MSLEDEKEVNYGGGNFGNLEPNPAKPLDRCIQWCYNGREDETKPTYLLPEEVGVVDAGVGYTSSLHCNAVYSITSP